MTSSSPLSSPAHSLDSFYSAHEGDTTAASSPIRGHPCLYRNTKQLPRELKQHCQILLEEQLYPGAISLLNSILGAGISGRSSSKPVAIPPPSHLALLSTLVVHPLYTTRVEKQEHLEISSQALGYLRNLVSIVGPLNADLQTAFYFHQTVRKTRRGNQSHGNNSDVSDGDSAPEDHLSGRLANESSLWNRGQDFWSVLGWAFNCSSIYPTRWKYWKAWLELMMDVLEADWNERECRDYETYESDNKAGDGEAPTASREGSMIVAYLRQQSGRKGTFKIIVKALLADGGHLSSTSFREIFDKEPRGPKQSRKRKRQALDLDNDQFGDYFDDDSISSGASEPPTPQKTREPDVAFGVSQPGLAESTTLRLRLFRLISSATHCLGKGRPEELGELYGEFSAQLQVLPLPLFSAIVTQRENPLLTETHVTVLKELFDLLLPGSHKKPGKVDPVGEAEGSFTPKMLEQCFVMHPANTVAVEDNAKLSLVVESAVQLLWSCDAIGYTDGLARSVEAGIAAREAKTAKTKKRTGRSRADPNDGLAQQVLANSSDRLRLLLGTMEAVLEMETN